MSKAGKEKLINFLIIAGIIFFEVARVLWIGK